MSLLLGIDLGTSYFKVGLFDAAGGMRGLGRVAVPKHAPATGWSELPVEEFWRLLRMGLSEALQQTGASPRSIRGMSYSSQANTFVLLDRSGRPLTPLVIWNDRRADPVDPDLAEFGKSEQFWRTAGFCGLSAEHAPAKWRWFQEFDPGLWQRAERVLTLGDYFAFALTGEAVGDTGTAAFTGLLDVNSGNWWADALRQYKVSPALLARPLRPGTPCGRTLARAGALLDLPPGVPFAVGSLDHHVAAIGSGLERLADASISTGTVLAALCLVDGIEPTVGCFHGPHTDGHRFFRLAFDLAGAGQIEEYHRTFAPEQSFAELIAVACTKPPDPMTELGRPQKVDRSHGSMIRRIMVKIGVSQRKLLNRVRGARAITSVIATGGGARSEGWLQLNANLLGIPVIVPRCPERACLGAAAFAAVAAGFHTNLTSALGDMVKPDRVIDPQPEIYNLYQSYL